MPTGYTATIADGIDFNTFADRERKAAAEAKRARKNAKRVAPNNTVIGDKK